MQKRIEIFCSYAHQDQSLHDVLRIHLTPLLYKQPVILWSDTDIHPGTSWKEALKDHLEHADIILLLISPDFIASDYCFSAEIQTALARHERGEACVIPVLLRPVDWTMSPFAQLQALPRNQRFLTTVSNRDEVLADITREIRGVIDGLLAKKAAFPVDRVISKSPHNLPRLHEFLGREKDVSHILKELSSRYPIISVEGFPGVGKTALAIKTAYESLTRGLFERIVWVSAENRPEQKEWLADVLNAIEQVLIPVVFDSSMAANILLGDKKPAVNQLLRTYRTLVIIDNYETIHDPALKTWIEDIPEPSKVLITSRASDWRKITSITLQGLENSEALEFIRSYSSRRRLPTLAVTAEEQLLPLIQVTAGNPQAILMALGHIEMGELSLTEVIEDLSLAKSSVGDIFSYLFEETWGHIRKDTKHVLMVVPFFANIISQQALAATTKLSNSRVKSAVEQLIQLMLLDIQQEQIISIQSYSVHPLTRAFAQTQLDLTPKYEQEARVYWSDYYVRFARHHLLRGQQEDRYWNTLVRSGEATQIDREWLNLLNVLEWADQTEQHQVLIDLVLLLSHYMNRHFHYTERLYYAHKAALAAEILNDRECAALLHIDTLGWTFIEKKRLEEAEKAIMTGLSIAQELDPFNSHTIDLLALAHIFLARVFLEQGLLEKAETSINQATEFDSKSVVQFRAAMIAGDIAYKKKELQKAIQFYNQAHSISLQYGQEGEDEDLAYRLGMAYLATKDPIQAEQSFKNLPNLPEQYSGVTTGIIYIKLGEAYVARINHNYEEASRLAQEALSYLSLGSDASHWMHDEIQRFLEETKE